MSNQLAAPASSPDPVSSSSPKSSSVLATRLKMGLIAVLAAGLYLGFFGGAEQAVSDKALPTFELPMLGGGTLVSSSLKGKVHVLNFFATWCGPCKLELPDFNRFYARQDPAKVAMYAIAAGDEHRLDVRAFIEQYKVAFPVALEGERLLAELSGDGLPTTVFVDEHGHIRHIIKGMLTEEKLEGMVKELLDAPAHP